MPHSFPGSHEPMIADLIKTLFIALAVTFLDSKKVPEVYTLFLTAVAIILYHYIVKPIAPGV
jgi:hypothetical protein